MTLRYKLPLALSLTAFASSAHTEEANAELSRLAIGEPIPNFSLKNATGETPGSNSLLTAGTTLAMVFFFSTS